MITSRRLAIGSDVLIGVDHRLQYFVGGLVAHCWGRGGCWQDLVAFFLVGSDTVEIGQAVVCRCLRLRQEAAGKAQSAVLWDALAVGVVGGGVGAKLLFELFVRQQAGLVAALIAHRSHDARFVVCPPARTG